MMDLHKAGAVAFTDGEHPVQNADLPRKTILYLCPLNASSHEQAGRPMSDIVWSDARGCYQHADWNERNAFLAEEMMLIRDLKLLEYALEKNTYDSGSPVLYISLVSTVRGVELIREAKAKGLPVSCDVAAHQLAYQDKDLIGFDTNLKN